MLSAIPGSIRAETDVDATKIAIENKEMQKSSSPLNNDQGKHSRRYRDLHTNRDAHVTLRADHRVHGNRYYEGRRSHHGAYWGGGSALILILILILVL